MGNGLAKELCEAVDTRNVQKVQEILSNAGNKASDSDMKEAINFVRDEASNSTILLKLVQDIITTATAEVQKDEVRNSVSLSTEIVTTPSENLQKMVEIAKLFITNPKTFLFSSTNSEHGDLNVLYMLSQMKHPACRWNIIRDLFRTLVAQNDKSPNFRLDYAIGHKETPLMICIANLNLEFVKILLDSNAVSIAKIDKEGDTPLHHIFKYDHNLNDLYLQDKANNKPSLTYRGFTEGRKNEVEILPQEILREILSSGCITNPQETKNKVNNIGETPLHVAVSQTNFSVPSAVVGEFIASGDVDVNATIEVKRRRFFLRMRGNQDRPPGGATPLFIVCDFIRDDRDDLVQVLLAGGAGSEKDSFFKSNQSPKIIKADDGGDAAKEKEDEVAAIERRMLGVFKKEQPESDDEEDDENESEEAKNARPKKRKINCFIAAVRSQKAKVLRLLLVNGIKPVFTVASVKEATVEDCLKKYADRSLVSILISVFGWSEEKIKIALGEGGEDVKNVEFVM